MPVYDLIIDDASPVIRFGSTWVDATKSGDGGIINYYNQTFHGTQGQGAQAQFSFYGTFVALYGSNWFNHGPYQVLVDGTVLTTNDGYTVDRNYQVQLASYALTLGNHDVQLINVWTDAGRSWLDLDYIKITTGDGNYQTSSQDYILDDTAANFTYDVAGGWVGSGNSLSKYYYQQTLHYTNTLNAKVVIVFDGNAVGLYGATSGNHGLYSVALDGGSSTVYNGSATAFRPGMLLYYASGLSSGSHTLTVTNLASGSSGFLDVDRLVVSRWESLPSSTPQPSASSSSGSHHKSNVGAIAGGAAGGAVAVLLIGLLSFCLLRRRRRREMVPTVDEYKPDLSAAHPTALVQPFAAGPEAAALRPQSSNHPAVFEAPPAYEEGTASPRRTESVAGSTVAGSTVGGSVVGSSAAASSSGRRPLPSPPVLGSGLRSEKGARG